MALVGRDAELSALVERVREHRLVTVVGPGGVGKTALARSAADTVGTEFPLGVRLVDLTRADEPSAVAELIAGQLGYADFHSLVNSTGDRPALLLIDNCEHVLDVAADAVDRILATCRMPTVLATSRSPLDIADEVIVPLAPLEVPRDDVDGRDTGSVRMFTERVMHFGGVVRPDDSEAVADICRRLDGVPLALEIAAARSRRSTIDEIRSDVDRRPSRLSRPRFRGHDAHRSVTAMVEWSLQLLTADALDAFESLGVIAGPFDDGMAGAVVDAAGPDEVAAVLDELVAASLVVPDTSGPSARYRILHPVRAVALDRVRRTGRDGAAIDRAVDHVVAVAMQTVADSAAGWSDQLSMLLGAYDNMIASLRWSNEHDERPNRPLTLLAVLWGVVHQAHTAEVAAVGEDVLARWNDPAVPFWADAAATVATCRNLLGRHDEAIELAEHALDHVGASPFAPGSLRRVIAQAHRATGRAEQARAWFAAGADAAEEAGVHGLAMELRVDQAIVGAELGDVDESLTIVDDVIEEAAARSAPINLAWARGGRGAILLAAGDDAALPTLVAALEYARSLEYPAGESFALRLVTTAQLRIGDDRAAAATILELLDALLERGGLNDLRMALDHAAHVLERAGDTRWLDVAATAQALPVTTVASAVESEVFDRAGGRGSVMPVRGVYDLCRAALAPIAAGMEPTSSSDAEAAGQPPGNALVLEGDVWRMTFDGRSHLVKASKGMNDLATLLAQPGREVAALDLMGSGKAGASSPDTLDTRARREIEERIRELQADVEEADAHHDPVRSERAASELDRLVEELSAAIGLGGRARATGSDPERARSAVTQRLRAAISRLDGLDSKLGGHLATSVETGTFCVYRPLDGSTWRVER